MVFALANAYLLGLISGVLLVMLYGLYQSRKSRDKMLQLATELKSILKDANKKATSIKDRLNRAHDITERQLEILYTLESPQRNSLDGRNKKSLNQELKQLEEDKILILESILKDGHDPKMVIINELGEREPLLLSEFLKRRKLTLDEANMPTEPDKQEPARKLTLVKSDNEASKDE